MSKADTLPRIGAVISIWLPGGVNRHGRIFGYDNHDEMALVRWIDYWNLPDEWIPTRHLA